MGEAYLFNYEDGTPKSLPGSLSFITGLLEDSYQEIIGLLSRDHKTPIKRLQHSCQEITRLLSRDYNTPIKRLQHSYESPINLL